MELARIKLFVNDLNPFLGTECKKAKQLCPIMYDERKKLISDTSARIGYLIYDYMDMTNEEEKLYKKLIAKEFNYALSVLQDIYANTIFRKNDEDKKILYKYSVAYLESAKIPTKELYKQPEEEITPLTMLEEDVLLNGIYNNETNDGRTKDIVVWLLSIANNCKITEDKHIKKTLNQLVSKDLVTIERGMQSRGYDDVVFLTDKGLKEIMRIKSSE
jgi:DNA-binding MarR family transcriptional regulator